MQAIETCLAHTNLDVDPITDLFVEVVEVEASLNANVEAEEEATYKNLAITIRNETYTNKCVLRAILTKSNVDKLITMLNQLKEKIV